MNSRERILTAINHEEPDKVPIDSWMAPEVANEIKIELIVTEAVDGAEAIKFFDESLDKGKSFDIVVTSSMMYCMF